MSFAAPKLTNAGKELYYENLAGAGITFTTIQLGSGTISGAIASMTALVNPVVTITAAAKNNGGQYVDISGAFSNAGLPEGFYWREIGVFAADPSDPDNRDADILYCYQNAYDTADFIPVASVETVEKNITVPIIVGDASGVSCTLTTSQIYATLQELEEKQDKIAITGMLKGIADDDGNITVTAATAGKDYQPATQNLKASTELTLEDTLPFFSTSDGENRRVTLSDLKDAMGVQSPSLNVTTCAGATVTATDGETTLTGSGSTLFSLPNIGTWTVTATLDDITVTREVEVTGALQYNVDMMITTGLAVTTAPAKTTYYIGDTFDAAGMVVTATFADGTQEDVTEDCTFSPTTMAASTTEVSVSYQRVGLTVTTTQEVSIRVLSSIQITTSPTKTAYQYGDTFNAAGMAVTATYTDGQTRAVTGYTYSPAGALGLDDTEITVSYTEGSVTATATVAITVANVLSSIAVTTAPSTTDYFEGQRFDTAGMVVTATYADGSTAAVTGYTYSPAGALSASTTAVTITYTEGSVTRTATVVITVTAISTTLNSNSWATIRAVSDAGLGENYWDTGDTKTITINGTVGNFTFSNLSISVFILGFDHNSDREGTNRIHFQIGKISGTMVGLCDSNYGSTSTSSGYFQMNTSNTNSGGWSSSYMRKTLLGNTNTPTSPLSGSLMAALPSDLRAVMKPVTKYSDNTGGGSNTASYVTATTDYLFLLSEYEYQGARAYANSAEQNYQAQYDYYKAGNSKIHYRHTATGTAVRAWCRSVYAGTSYYFCRVNTDGTASYADAFYSWAVAPGFAA